MHLMESLGVDQQGYKSSRDETRLLTELVKGNGERRLEEISGGKTSSSTSSLKQIADPVVYKLVRVTYASVVVADVEGDGRLVPATDDEVMEVEDLLEDDKSEMPLVEDTGQMEGCISNEMFSYEKANLVGSEGLSQSENAEVDAKKLNARLGFIKEMLQKVKQEERLRLLCGSPDHSSDCINLEGQCYDQHDILPAKKLHDILPAKKLQSEIPLQEIVSSMSPRLNDSHTNHYGSVDACSKPADGPTDSGSSASAVCISSKLDFSNLNGEICLDNLSIRELHETFKATFGRETSVKDKLWLKRRIAMGLTNSCDVSTTTFIIKDKTLVKNVKEESGKSVDSTLHMDLVTGVITENCDDSPISPTNQMEDQQLQPGKRLRKSKAEYDCETEDLHMEQRAAKRVRKPTRRYIEELSDVEYRECSGRLLSSVKNFEHVQSSPNSSIRPVRSVGSDAFTRQESIGGSGVQVPYVSRVRRGRPRKNFMALMKFHPSGMGIAAKLLKKARGVRVSRADNESGSKFVKEKSAPRRIQLPIGAETEKDRQTLVTCVGEQQRDVELKNLDTSGYSSGDNVVTVPSTKGGARRKHHRAWTLSEVMKLVEGVSRYGAGRWSEIKRLAFASYDYRTSVDLKMNNSRKHASMPIPAPILLRVRELAEMHMQASRDPSSSKLADHSGRNVHETRSGYL
ncbi:hypothetical protein HHK36_025433 [Tetracentron sinense]|uniref:Uncharacterized protein n=1 Tax=Tetracentron sinense TaxID=13715 RepID=A0A835D348_TETSI|nr:hypothetical protein HHK36_025433 [Tetracentron sinense]